MIQLWRAIFDYQRQIICFNEYYLEVNLKNSGLIMFKCFSDIVIHFSKNEHGSGSKISVLTNKWKPLCNCKNESLIECKQDPSHSKLSLGFAFLYFFWNFNLISSGISMSLGIA